MQTEKMSYAHLAWEFAELFEGLTPNQINEMLAKNIPFETLQFFADYAKDFSEVEGIKDDTNKRIPNLLILGYLLHVLEDRLIPTEDEEHN
jgi:hypothetical protein